MAPGQNGLFWKIIKCINVAVGATIVSCVAEKDKDSDNSSDSNGDSMGDGSIHGPRPSMSHSMASKQSMQVQYCCCNLACLAN